MWPWKKQVAPPAQTGLASEVIQLELDDTLTRSGAYLNPPAGCVARKRVELGIPRAEIDEILASAYWFAADVIQADGHFAPFAITLTPAGVPSLILVNFEGPEAGQPEVDRLVAVLRARKMNYRAIAIGTDYTFAGAPHWFIRVFVEHRLHPPVLGVREYWWKRGRLHVDAAAELKGILQVFSDQDVGVPDTP